MLRTSPGSSTPPLGSFTEINDAKLEASDPSSFSDAVECGAHFGQLAFHSISFYYMLRLDLILWIPGV